MPRISEIEDDGGDPTLKAIFDRQRELFGDVLNPTKVHGALPADPARRRPARCSRSSSRASCPRRCCR